MKDSAFSRLNYRLRGMSQVAIQVAQGEMDDIKVIGRHPTEIRQATKQFRTLCDLLDEVADEEEVSLAHRKERADAYVTMAGSSSNAATILGSDGQNIKIIIFSDPAFVLEVLTEGQLEALEQAFRQLPAEQKKRITKWLK